MLSSKFPFVKVKYGCVVCFFWKKILEKDPESRTSSVEFVMDSNNDSSGNVYISRTLWWQSLVVDSRERVT